MQARVTQDRVRVTVKFGESAWLEPNSARALAVALVALACQLEADHEASAWPPGAQAAEDAKHAGEQWPPGNGWPRPEAAQ